MSDVIVVLSLIWLNMETVDEVLQGILSRLLGCNLSTSSSLCLQHEPNTILVRFYFTLSYLMLTMFALQERLYIAAMCDS